MCAGCIAVAWQLAGFEVGPFKLSIQSNLLLLLLLLLPRDLQCRYEFGVVTNGRNIPASISDLASYTITGLPKGSSTIYGCAVDADGAHFCTSGDVVVKDPPANFSAAAALDSVDVTQAASTGDVAALTKIAMSVSNLAAYVTASSVSLAQTLTSTTAAAAQAKVDAKAASIITSLAAKVDARDHQAMQTVVTAVVSLGKASANMSAATKASVLSVTSAGKGLLHVSS